MKRSSRDKKPAVFVLSLGIVAASWFGGAEAINRRTEEMGAQKEELQIEYDERMKVLEKKELYLSDIKNYNDAYAIMLARYPAGISQVSQILFVTELEERFNTQVVSTAYTDETELYSFQSVEPDNREPYTLVDASLQISLTLDYDSFKDFLDYVYSYEDKSTIREITTVFDDIQEKVDITVIINQYAVKGEDRILKEAEPEVPLGTDNIFKTGTELSYDGGKTQQIEAVKKNHDCYVMLHPSASDVKAKVIAGPKEEEKVISERNAAEMLSIVAEKQDSQSGMVEILK